MTVIEANAGVKFDPMLVEHCLKLAEEFLEDTKPAAVATPAIVVRVGPIAWFVLQTVVRGEDAVIEALGELGFESYAPTMLMEVTHHRTRRPVMREFKLFNRYLFARLPLDTRQWRTVEAIEEVDYALGANGVPCPIGDGEIARFKRAQAEGLFDVTKAASFPIGSRVRALSGPFSGFSGLVDSLPGRGVVKAMVQLLGGLVPVEFPFDMVEPE
jgi:transcription antitermination factor NusG